MNAEELTQIQTIVMSHDRVIGIYDLRTRQAGAQRFIQFHLELADELSLLEAHEIGEAIEQEICSVLEPCEVFIHHDPTSTVDSGKKAFVNL